MILFRKKHFKRIISFYRNNKEAIIYYTLFKVIVFWVFVLAVKFLKSRLTIDSQFVYDLEILKFINPNDVFVLIVLGIFWIISFILERNFLIFYFVNKFKKKRIKFKLFLKDFLLKQFVQLKLFLLEISINLFYVSIFSLALYADYYFFKFSLIFYLLAILIAGIVFYWSVKKFIKFIFVMFTFFDNPTEKNIFKYFSLEVSRDRFIKTIAVVLKSTIFFFLISGISLGIAWLVEQFILRIDYFAWQVYLIVLVLFLQIIFLFAVGIMVYIFVFLKLAEIFFGKTISRKIVDKDNSGKTLKIKTGRILVGSVLLIGLIGVYFYLSFTIQKVLQEQNKPKLIFAHRGFSDHYVQNSLPAFKGAVGRADFAELDVQITKDNKLIVFHDKNFKKLTGQVGIASQRNFSEIHGYRVREYKKSLGKEMTSPVISLEDVLQNLAGKINFAIEIKNTDPNKEDEIVRRVAKLMQKYKIKDSSVVISLDYGILQKLKKIDPKIKRGLILTYSVNNLNKFDVDFYFVNSLINSDALIKQAHKLGRPIYFWRFEFVKDDFEEEYILGADGFVADNPSETRSKIMKYKKMSLPHKINIILKNLLK